MAVKVNKMADKRSLFKRELLNSSIKSGETLLNELHKEVKKTLGQTFSDTNTGFKGATVKMVDDNIIKTEKGVKVQARFFVADSSGQPHFVWHIVNRGRKSGTISSNIAFRPRRKPNRTQKMSLKMRPYQGEEDHMVFMSKGSFLAGFEGREFYQVAMLEIKEKIFGKNSKFSGWKLVREEVKND